MAIIGGDGIPVTDTQGRKGTLHVDGPKTVYGGWQLQTVFGDRVETQSLDERGVKALMVKLLCLL